MHWLLVSPSSILHLWTLRCLQTHPSANSPLPAHAPAPAPGLVQQLDPFCPCPCPCPPFLGWELWL
eukprot:1141857-Pelagomonas_calceolata.AAC.1